MRRDRGSYDAVAASFLADFSAASVASFCFGSRGAGGIGFQPADWIAAWAAANLAIGTRKGEQLT